MPTTLLSPSPPSSESPVSPIDNETPAPSYANVLKSKPDDSDHCGVGVKCLETGVKSPLEAGAKSTLEVKAIDLSLRTSVTFSSSESGFDWCCPKNDINFAEGV